MLEIRQYQSADHDAVWELHHLALVPTGAFLRGGHGDDDLHDIQNHYLNNAGEFLVGILDDRIVCMGAFRKKSAKITEIKRMRVHPDFQRRGFGQMLLDKLQEMASQLGYAELCLDTTTLQAPAQRLYEKNGFREVRRGRIAGLHLIFYEKTLTQNIL